METQKDIKQIMKFKRLGKTNTKIPAIGQGSMGVGGYLSRDSQQDDNQIKAIKLGIELNMTFIDTAEVYGNGHAEELIAKAIKGVRDKVFIATKFSPEHNSYKDVLKSAERSLRRLKTDYIDLYQIHWPNPSIPLSETLRAMVQLIKGGKVRYIGVSNFSHKKLREARSVVSGNEIVSLQAEYNFFDRNIENDLLPYCETEGITTIAYSPLDQGKIAGGDKRIIMLQKIADKYHRTKAQITLNWLVSHPSVIVIPKATNPDHIKQNASSTDFELSDEDIKEIGRVFTQECKLIPTERIRVIMGGERNRKVYQTVEEALENKLDFVPSPVDLAEDIREEEILKPIKVIRSTDKTGKYDYDLVEGRIRYWAWVIAHNGKQPIPAYIRE